MAEQHKEARSIPLREREKGTKGMTRPTASTGTGPAGHLRWLICGLLFVVDAGWYGPEADDWWSQAGDWRERQSAAFGGHMQAFADEVALAGLGFGLWMEPERFGAGVPIRQEHPEWFLPFEATFALIDLTRPDACEYLKRESAGWSRRTNWMKVHSQF